MQHVFAIVYILFVCWLSTGVIIYLDSLPPRTFRWSLSGATLVLVAALWGLAATRDSATVAGAYVAFTCGTLAYGWHKMSFYMGFVTGPRRSACSPHCHGWRHFMHGVETILYHELVVIATALLIPSLTWRGTNHVGLWTYITLWAMQQSARLNVFWGVRNLDAEMLPAHMRFLGRYFRKRFMNPFFPVSITVASVVAMLLLGRAFTTTGSAFEAISQTFIGTLIVAAVFEHVMLMVPLPQAWQRVRTDPQPQPAASGHARPLLNALGAAVVPKEPQQ